MQVAGAAVLAWPIRRAGRLDLAGVVDDEPDDRLSVDLRRREREGIIAVWLPDESGGTRGDEWREGEFR